MTGKQNTCNTNELIKHSQEGIFWGTITNGLEEFISAIVGGSGIACVLVIHHLEEVRDALAYYLYFDS